MRRSHAVLAVFIAILLVILVRQSLRKQVEERESNETSEERVQAQVQTVTPSPSTTPAHLASPSPGATPTRAAEDNKQKGSGKLEFPTTQEVREQVSQDPHHTPQALIQFAKDLSARAEAAKQSQGTAQEFFGVLEDCLASGKDPSESIPMPAQLTCLTTAEEFAKLYPNELGQRLKPLQQNASPELKRIRSTLDRF